MDEIFKAIGLMSGTSLDGEIDVALIETDGRVYVKPLDFYAHPYAMDVRDVVRSCFGTREVDERTIKAERLVTDLHIEAVKASGFAGDIIGFHGQTITHAPDDQFTWQLGDGALMAAALGVDVVSDFRSADIAAGGQGAPLAPLYHAAMMARSAAPVCVLNLGGVGNVSYIGGDDLIAFDTGPANAMLDDYCKAHFGCDYDADGVLAKAGRVEEALVSEFLTHPYFAQKPPKSLDRNAFHACLKHLPDDPKDALATLTAMSVAAVAAAQAHVPQAPVVWYVCGGGRKNAHMMALLAQALKPAAVMPIEDAGYNGDAIEAQAFAYLAVRSKLGLPLSLPSTTGVAAAQTGGVYHKA
ncbi:MAG: anhydro-N-acetylmuramic acid kinase [Bdellovibrionales bacterium]